MKCTNCGYEIPEGMLYCKRCGQEIRIVPDYNPLDDMLTTQIKVSINTSASRQTGKIPNNKISNNKTSGNTASSNVQREKEARRRQAERRRELKRKKRRRLIMIMVFIFFVIIGATILLYQNSYSGIVKKGNKALLSSEYKTAREYFLKAIDKDPKASEAYIGLSKIYITDNDLVRAENVFLDAISSFPDSTALYDACVQFYLDTNQVLEIPLLMNEADSKIKNDLNQYIVEKPVYSLEPGKIYDDVQQIELISEADTIYYTTDGTSPSLNSTKYTQAIQLDEGETVVKAIAVNKSGVPSLPEEKTYVIELPIEDAPAVSPSTGQYTEAVQIEIKVPDGYSAYYTMDGSTPTTASTRYTEPIDMPENDTLFKAILVNSSGRSSGVTTRNYILDIQELEE